jgi:hypothetical protein
MASFLGGNPQTPRARFARALRMSWMPSFASITN